jgi:hypothetical protein
MVALMATEKAGKRIKPKLEYVMARGRPVMRSPFETIRPAPADLPPTELCYPSCRCPDCCDLLRAQVFAAAWYTTDINGISATALPHNLPAVAAELLGGLADAHAAAGDYVGQWGYSWAATRRAAVDCLEEEEEAAMVVMPPGLIATTIAGAMGPRDFTEAEIARMEELWAEEDAIKANNDFLILSAAVRSLPSGISDADGPELLSQVEYALACYADIVGAAFLS